MDFAAAILAELAIPDRPALRPKKLADELGLLRSELGDFKAALEELIEQGRVKLLPNGTLRLRTSRPPLIGTIRRSMRGAGTFFPREEDRLPEGQSIAIPPDDMGTALTGDKVAVRLKKNVGRDGEPLGRVVEVLERATNTFVGTYREHRGRGYVQLDGSLADLQVMVGDPGAKGAVPEDKVVVELIHFPTLEEPGEGVLVEVLGARNKPGVDLKMVMLEFNLRDEFPEGVLAAARQQAHEFEDKVPHDRLDLTDDLIVTIDPIDARDFDDAISLDRLADGGWKLGVHIADVAHFVQLGTPLDDEARRRGTSVYLPGKVIPMLPELISNGLASLQQGRIRYTKSAYIEYDASGVIRETSFHNSAIRVVQRFAYEQVLPLLAGAEMEAAEASLPVEPGSDALDIAEGRAESRADSAHDDMLRDNARQAEPLVVLPDTSPEVLALLRRMRELARILRARRKRHGALDLALPEVKVDLNHDGEVVGAHRVHHDESHQIIEEFMLAANVAVARELARREIAFLRRAHPGPDERKLRGFGDFVRALGYSFAAMPGRAQLQRLLEDARGAANEMAINYALLRSLKQADYRPDEEGHFALAEEDYCHFTSPIRRYPDLTIHRTLDEVIRHPKRPRVTDPSSLKSLGEWCSFTERQAADAERELTKLKLLSFMAQRVGQELPAVVTGVERFGIFCQGIEIPAEGMVHISKLPADNWDYDAASHTLVGRRSGGQIQLGDRFTVRVAGVDLARRTLNLELVDRPRRPANAGRPHRSRGADSDTGHAGAADRTPRGAGDRDGPPRRGGSSRGRKPKGRGRGR